MSTPLLIPRCCSAWRSGVCGDVNCKLYTEVRAKMPLSHKQRKALLSHWSPRVAKAIVKKCYPDFRGTYEQNLWLLTRIAAKQADPSVGVENCTSYAREASEKGILFLWPYPRIEDKRICCPSHYMYYILNWKNAEVNAILGNVVRRSQRLNAKYLIEALRLIKVYMDLPDAPSRYFDDPEPSPVPSAAYDKARITRRKALKAAVKAQMMLTLENSIEFKVIAYGWTHLRKQATVS